LVTNSNKKHFYAHPTSTIDLPTIIGEDTKIWHYTHIMGNAVIGSNCIIGQNVFVASNVKIGDNVKVQNNVSLFEGVQLEDDVFCGPSCVFTNVVNPRSEIVRKNNYQKTIVKKGATIGANATIICPAEIGQYAFIGAGAVVKGIVPPYALMVGIPAVQKGWIGRHGYLLQSTKNKNIFKCDYSNWDYELSKSGILKCLNWPEEKPLK
tara:strand:- start:449 stop:1072 length:624 start_codon:yes stop_codon:yes gene_type:complete